MAYTTQSQIIIAAGGQVAFDQIFDYDGDGVADADVIAQAMIAADGLIDQYLRNRYRNGIVSPSPSLQMLAADEAVYYGKKYKPALGVTAQDVEERASRLRELEAFRDGKNNPENPSPAAQEQTSKAVFVENLGAVSRRNIY